MSARVRMRTRTEPKEPGYVGIDPGATGGVAKITKDSEFVCVYDMPTMKVGKRTRLDPLLLVEMLQNLTEDGSAVGVEEAGTMPGQSAQSGLTTGIGYGVILGVIHSLGLRHYIVRPNVWKRTMLEGISGSKSGREGKQASLLAATRWWPRERKQFVGPKGGHKDGRTEALLIAEFTRRSTKL